MLFCITSSAIQAAQFSVELSKYKTLEGGREREMQLITIANLNQYYVKILSQPCMIFIFRCSFLYFIFGGQGNMPAVFSALLLVCAGSII